MQNFAARANRQTDDFDNFSAPTDLSFDTFDEFKSTVNQFCQLGNFRISDLSFICLGNDLSEEAIMHFEESDVSLENLRSVISACYEISTPRMSEILDEGVVHTDGDEDEYVEEIYLKFYR